MFIRLAQEKFGDAFFLNVYLGSQYLNPTSRVKMTRFVPDLIQELTEQSIGFKIFGTLSLPQKIGDLYSYLQKTLSTRSIKLEFCGQFVIYGIPELIFLNCYYHCSSLVLSNVNGTDSFLHSRQGVTQGGGNIYFCLRYRHLSADKN